MRAGQFLQIILEGHWLVSIFYSILVLLSLNKDFTYFLTMGVDKISMKDEYMKNKTRKHDLGGSRAE